MTEPPRASAKRSTQSPDHSNKNPRMEEPESSNSTPLKLRFGHEIEIVIQDLDGKKDYEHLDPKLKAYSNFEPVPEPLLQGTADRVKKKLLDKGIKSRTVYEAARKLDFSVCCIGSDDSVGCDWHKSERALEISSPIFEAEEEAKWVEEFKTVWDVLEEFEASPVSRSGDTKGSMSSASQTHVSIAGSKFSPDQLRRISKHALRFERANDSLVHESRRQDVNCKSNLHQPSLVQSKDLATRFQTIDGAETIMAIVDTLCPPTRSDPFHRKYRLNLRNLLPAEKFPDGEEGRVSKGTIEFRQPQGASCLEETLMWIRHACSFTGAALAADGDGAVSSSPPSRLSELQDFLGTGAALCGFADASWLDDLFRDKALLEAPKYVLKDNEGDDQVEKILARKGLTKEQVIR